MELIDLVNSPIFFLFQMTLLRWYLSYSDPWLLLLQSYSFGFISYLVLICSTVAFLPLGHSDQVVSVSNGFLSNSKRDALLHRIGLPSYSKLDWSSLLISIAKTAPQKMEPCIVLWSFLSLELALYLYKSTIWPCLEYCCRICCHHY